MRPFGVRSEEEEEGEEEEEERGMSGNERISIAEIERKNRRRKKGDQGVWEKAIVQKITG